MLGTFFGPETTKTNRESVHASPINYLLALEKEEHAHI
jgi:hypothetical protein